MARQTPITLPQTAIVFSPYGDTVFVVTKAKDAKGRDTLIAQQRFVTLGDARGDQVAILSGLKPDEDVVSAGQDQAQERIARDDRQFDPRAERRRAQAAGSVVAMGFTSISSSGALSCRS